MAQHLTEKVELDYVLTILKKELPDSIIVYSVLNFMLENGRFLYKTYVDDFKSISCVLLVPDGWQNIFPFQSVYIYIFSGGIPRLYRMLNQSGIIDWNQEMEFYGIANTVWDEVKRKLKSYDPQGFLPKEHDEAILYYVDSNDSILNIDVPEGLKSGPMNEQALKTAIAIWKFTHEGVLQYTRELLSLNMPNVCLYKDGKPVGWVLQHMTGDIGLLYVVPDFRGKGCGKYLLAVILKQSIERYGLACSFVETCNSLSCKLHEYIGMRKFEKKLFIWQRFRYKLLE